MACRVSLTFLTEEAIVRALRLRAAKEGVRPEEAASALLRAALVAEIEEAAGLPPLADVIQDHHHREQQARKSRSSSRGVPGQRP